MSVTAHAVNFEAWHSMQVEICPRGLKKLPIPDSKTTSIASKNRAKCAGRRKGKSEGRTRDPTDAFQWLRK